MTVSTRTIYDWAELYTLPSEIKFTDSSGTDYWTLGDGHIVDDTAHFVSYDAIELPVTLADTHPYRMKVYKMFGLPKWAARSVGRGIFQSFDTWNEAIHWAQGTSTKTSVLRNKHTRQLRTSVHPMISAVFMARHRRHLTSPDSEHLPGHSSSPGCGDRQTTYIKVRSRLHTHVSDLIAGLTGHPHAQIYAVMVFHNPEDFQAACRAMRDRHGMSAG
ncbi:hypothetical protein [Nocardia terpenica]|uniref:Uncharacterized protein n=1 Tax=Nocardia terpenica TaxID=455432 RepID=A0A164NZV1_9NOCA|nr:hypothetical protein [Nocardia terpenica]KZM74930.1 hypothetical protein AWN90_23240 [Nocardia terpenica]NQE93406.1 hypothetical protein [Nocardia terpenica]